MSASSGVVGALLDYIYGGEPDVSSMDAVELLRLAGAYGLPCLAEAVEADLLASLDSRIALQLLQEAVDLGIARLTLGLWRAGRPWLSAMHLARRLSEAKRSAATADLASWRFEGL